MRSLKHRALRLTALKVAAVGGGRSASYRITVQSNGNLLIGSAYTKQMGLKPGDEFEISLGRKHIRLTQIDSDSNEADISEESDSDLNYG